MPEVSVIIPAYNAAFFLAAAICSVLQQTRADLEIIVVDDGSTDDTRGVATSFGSLVRYFLIPNSGPSAARNFGIGKAVGKYVAFLDADDWWLPHKLQTQLEIFSINSGISFVCSDWFNGETGEEARASVLSGYKVWEQSANFDLLLDENFVNTSTVVVERDVLIKAGLFMERLRGAEDRHLWLRLFAEGHAIVCKEILAFRRFHPANTTSTLPYINSRVLMIEDVLTWPAVKTCPARFDLVQTRYNNLRVGLAYKLSTMGRYSEAAAVYRQLYLDSFGRYQAGIRFLWFNLLGLFARKD
jgi:glycosyltransferase involved in cell wall biosynthesis